jgi:hypothetical protein
MIPSLSTVCQIPRPTGISTSPSTSVSPLGRARSLVLRGTYPGRVRARILDARSVRITRPVPESPHDPQQWQEEPKDEQEPAAVTDRHYTSGDQQDGVQNAPAPPKPSKCQRHRLPLFRRLPGTPEPSDAARPKASTVDGSFGLPHRNPADGVEVRHHPGLRVAAFVPSPCPIDASPSNFLRGGRGRHAPPNLARHVVHGLTSLGHARHVSLQRRRVFLLRASQP